MKNGIHPKYNKVVVRCATCGAEFETGTTAKQIVVDTCANCHPFYTGKQRFVNAQGRAELFKKKYGMA